MAHPLCMKIGTALLGIPYREAVRDFRVLGRAQMNLAEKCGVEVLSVCSDPVRELADLGAAIVWFDDDPPMADPTRPLAARVEDFLQLPLPDPKLPGRMRDRVDGVAELRRLGGNRWPVQGWVEGPMSLAAGARGLTQTIEDMIDDPKLAASLFRFSTDVAIGFARAQVEAGAHLIGIGDAPASLVGPDLYQGLVLPEEQRLIQAIHGMGVVAKLHICGNTSHLLPLIGSTRADLVDLDSKVDLASARAAFPPSVAILGNLDPVRAVRDSSPARIQEDLAQCRAAVGDRYVAGAGCEIPADTSAANLAAFGEFVRSCA